MNYPEFRALVKAIDCGKHLPDSIYIHGSAIGAIPNQLAKTTISIAQALKIKDASWNIVKYYKRDFKLSLLHYPAFDQSPYPSLHRSFTIDLEKLTMRESNYVNSENPPILHRKETLVMPDYKFYSQFKKATEAGEKIGLYAKPSAIGFKKQWEQLITKSGYSMNEDGTFSALSLKPHLEDSTTTINIERHRTAIDRQKLSQPMQILARHNYFDGERSVLDYGCGKGDDLRELESHGIDIQGWDPKFLPDNDLSPAQIVNLGFVLNVIEDRQERSKTLVRAWEYATELLVISVMIGGERIISRFRPYKDGVVTQLNTFQKYYSQSEIRDFIETTLKASAIAMAPGIFFVFRDKLQEQDFLLERQHIKRSWEYRTQRSRPSGQTTLTAAQIENNNALFRDYWATTLDLGRIPANTEFEYSDQIRRLAGSHSKAHGAMLEYFEADQFSLATQRRREDLLVYFALGQFDKRKPYTQLPERLKRDIKYFFQSLKIVNEEARKLLFSLGNPEVVYQGCSKAFSELGSGIFEDNHSFTFHKRHLNETNPILRSYVGCATQLFGTLDNIHLIKAHIRSGKVTFLQYENWEDPAPKLVNRIKVKLRDQDLDFFDYSDSAQFLEDKEVFESTTK